MQYPVDLEQWWVQLALRHLKVEDFPTACETLQPAVRWLCDTFTTERKEGVEPYDTDPDLLIAYGLYYFPQTYARTLYPLDELLRFRKWNPGPKVRVLDLGCGLGASGLAIYDRLKSEGKTVEMHAWDQSSPSLELLQKLVRETRNTEWNCRKEDLHHLKLEKAEWDLIVMSFSLNELFTTPDPAWINSLLNSLTPNGILLILEPATQIASNALMTLRDHFAEQGKRTILGPCLHHAACPLRKDGKFWCHEVRIWQPPESLEFLNRRLYHTIRELKFSFLVLGSQPLVPSTGTTAQLRLISPLQEENGKTAFIGCAADGDKHRYEILHRHLEKAERKDLMKIERGNLLQVDPPQPKSSFLRFEKFPGILWEPK